MTKFQRTFNLLLPLPLSPPLPSFSLLKRNRKTLESPFFQGFWKDKGKEEDRFCGLSSSPFWCGNGLYIGYRKDLGREEEEASFFARSDTIFTLFMLVQRKPNFDIGEKWFPARQLYYSNSLQL